MDYIKQVKIEKEITTFLNLAMYQHQINFLSNLMVANQSGVILEKIRIDIESDMDWMEPYSYQLAYLPIGVPVKIPIDKIILKPASFIRLSEVERASFHIRIYQQENLLVAETAEIELQPLSFFGGFNILPELLASYITPNHPYVYAIKHKAIVYLEQQNLAAKFEGYQSEEPARILEMMRAIYKAIQEEEIVYSALPPSFENKGQRLRLLDMIATEHFGNCIDLSLLFAACLEAIDLNPIIIVTKGHAFVGCWLHQDKFPQIINEDKTAITKRFAKGISELAVIEATSVCKGNNITFNEAKDLAEASLIGKEDFILSIDIKQARANGIKPLPLKIDTTTADVSDFILKNASSSSAEEKIEIGKIYEENELKDSSPVSKQKVWERKLLDLSLRNNLLNLRTTKNMLQLMDVDIHELENILADGKSFSISPSANASILKQYNIFNEALHPSSSAYLLAKEELTYNRLVSYYHSEDLDTILTHIYRNAKLSIEENGSSTLYLAIGLLKWRDKKTPDQVRSAPILLIPVELSRRSINAKFTLRSREEETMINITLLEFLRQEYELDLSGLEELPQDGRGVDVAQVITQVRRAIMGLKGWDIADQVILGNFSFNKLILWNDIANQSEAIAKSNIVKSLIDGQLRLPISIENTLLDFDNINPTALALPIATDVSQLEAIYTSNQNQSFILHGPPGTGKSQTITNIIANALYQGKKVLFVAAKKAALDVVHKRLAAIGLANFCLELHSNKAKKSDVLAQLAQTLDQPQLKGNFSFQEEANQLINAKKDLQVYIELLHAQQPIGWSLYDSIIEISTLESYGFSKIHLSTTIFDTLTPEKWRSWQDLIQDLYSVSQIITKPSQNPLKGIALNNFSPIIQQQVESSVSQLQQRLLDYEKAMQTFTSALEIPVEVHSWENMVQFNQFAQLLLTLPETNLTFWQYLLHQSQQNILDQWLVHFEDFQKKRIAILSLAHKSVLDANLTALESIWNEAKQRWFLPKWFKKRNVKKGLANYSTISFDDDDTIDQFFEKSNAFQQAESLVKQHKYAVIPQLLSDSYLAEETNLELIKEQAIQLKRLTNTLTSLVPSISIHDLLARWIGNAKRKTNQFILNQEQELKRLVEIGSTLISSIDIFQNETQLAIRTYPIQSNWIAEMKQKLSGILQHIDQLKNWTNYSKTKEKAEALDLHWLMELYESDTIDSSHLIPHFEYLIHYNLANKIIAEHEPLTMFNVRLFEDKIEKYKQIAKTFTELTKKELLLRLNERLPNTTIEAMQGSEIGILQRAIKNRGRGVSIRRLFDQIPTLLPRLAPCILMSPISVAQYFEVNPNQFDLLIFDEASQLPTCEAVSSLARAQQAIIVGDPKQMPPTSFFMTNKVDEEHLEVEDLESILDDCLSLSFPSKYLLRHYRSKHESLIAFSNANYYDNKLLTFPSADDLNSKVTHQYVEGHYDKGKSRQNKYEAQAIVDDIAKRFRHEKNRKQSIGIVTFSQVQQSLIEDKLNELYRLDSELERWATEGEEPIFIKNLENVQGDERDVILFSIGYGPDENGVVSMNFGPLNREGGWRRLNVAVTRAREEMKVFSTLRADQINLNRTASEGVAGLKNFLTFAERGYLAIEANQIKAEDTAISLSQNIAKRLRAEGLVVNENIGTSDYKVDLGIVHPHHPQRYILSILLDGDNYYEADTTNDRELVLPQMLESLGWNLYRIWSLDWIEHADSIVESVLERVNGLLLKTEKEPENTIEADAAMNMQELHIEEIDAHVVISKQIPYESTVLKRAGNKSVEGIYDFNNATIIREQIKKIIETESPISKSLLYKRIFEHWDITRTGARVEQLLSTIMEEIRPVTKEHQQPYYWKDQGGEELDTYRSNDLVKRNMEDIAPEELIVAIREAVERNISVAEEDLIRYLARQFSFQKVGKQIDSATRYAIDLAVEKQILKKENGRIKMVEVK
ncbi:DUF3320 domain-containing protein [Sphingobacterium sp. SRCM116780]|uniref:DUF3320 domain-containing protein n=1 Tax=Sphingobacterium sp. SRCM116780 TaxID=2907623 RepID=UPI001F2B807E|nr:DUF3320 domain-containing protein [Sphingobacterium sp. SRCM116780]UIR57063.1 DUF3320 domain-containing protein [Sphingobacterium sp. SRCM116780]